MTRFMYDFTHANASAVKSLNIRMDMIAWYGTGTGDIQWTGADKAMFHGANMIEIDQGANGSPVLTAQIRDVENGAWSPGQAVDKTGWHVARPTLYGGRNAIDQCIADGWRGDVWLAAPGTDPRQAPVIPGVNVVAVQNNWGALYDSSVVFDATWYPGLPPTPPAGAFSVTVAHRTANMFLPGHAGADHYLVMYSDSAGIASVVLDRPPARTDGAGIHLNNVIIPGASGGKVSLACVVDGTPVNLGSHILP